MPNLPKRVLVTGFGPFDGDSVNPSGLLLEWLNSQTFNFELQTVLLPVSFAQAYPQLSRALEAFNRSELTLERIAINWVDARIPDNDGLVLKTQKIKEESEDGLFTTLPLLKMLESANKVGCPAKISTSAGEYVCNHLIYLYLAENRTIPGTFIHLPAATNHQLFFQGISAIISSLE